MPTRIAPHLAARRWWRSGKAAISPSGGSSPPGTMVELQLGGSWFDITGYVRYASRIAITRGRSDEGKQVERGTCRLTLDNTDGRFSPRNPMGAWYGLIGRNTPLRASVPYLGGRAYRFHGEVSEWPVKWDTKGVDVNVPIEASGILRRLGQGATPLLSAPRRFYEAHSPSSYRHLEEGPLTPFSSTAAKVNFRYGEGKLAAWLPPSLNIIGRSVSTGIALTNVTTPTTTAWAVDFMYATDTDKTFTARVFDAGDPGFSGAVKFTASSEEVELIYTLTDTGVDQSLSITSTALPFDNKPHHVRYTAEQNGNDIDFEVYLDGALLATGTKTSASQSVTGVDQFWLFPYVGSDGNFIALGHVAAFVLSGAPDVADAADAALGHQAETAGRRIERLCAEQGIEFTAAGDLDDTTPMGPQYPDTLVSILREAADTDVGILYEPRNHIGFGYRTRSSLYNQTPRLALDYGTDGFVAELEPVDDDQAVRNDVTVTRREGGSARDTQDTGPLSTQAPPDGVGTYDVDVTINTVSDGVLPDHASWRLNLGTVDEPRYPTIAGFVNDDEISEGLRLALLDTDVGDRVTVDDPPAWLLPDQISALVQGTSEVIDDFVYELGFTTSPESPYQVGVYDEDSRYDTPGTTLDAAVDADGTSWTVSTIAGVIWGTDDLPYDVGCEGERVTVTAVTGSTPAGQVLTVTRSVNGAVMPHPAGAAVSLWTAARYPL